jgi:RNA 2',3'-cyclic 3'-phosphodiesterase
MLDPDLLTGRLFLAVGIPPPTRAPLEALLPDLRVALPQARFTTPAGWHVTCAFLGQVRAESAADVAAVAHAAATAARPASLHLDGAGGFPTPARARVLWTGLAGDLDILQTLAADLAAGFRAAGLRAEDRPFRGHLTLARLPKPAALPQPTLDALTAAAAAAPGFTATALGCYRSTLTNKGARYQLLRQFPLGGDGRGKRDDQPLSPDSSETVDSNASS